MPRNPEEKHQSRVKAIFAGLFLRFKGVLSQVPDKPFLLAAVPLATVRQESHTHAYWAVLQCGHQGALQAVTALE